MQKSGRVRALAVTGAVLLVLVGVTGVLAGVPGRGGAPAHPDADGRPAVVVAAEAGPISVSAAVSSLAVLRDWDVDRAAAWAGGDVAGLRRLYVRGSAAGRADVAMLRSWLARGLRVEGMAMQVLAVELRRRTERRVELVVTDRLVGAVAVPADGHGSPLEQRALPQDGASTRTLVFHRSGGRWRLASSVPA